MNARLCVVGAGRSGAVTAACLAELGHTVCAVDVDARHVAKLSEGRAPFYEPGLDAIIGRNLEAGRVSFRTDLAQGVPTAQCVLLCVDTPPARNGESNLSSVFAAVDEVAPLLSDGAIVITRSTVPVGTNAMIAERIGAARATSDVAANPEFLREGRAVQDFMHPERIVIGARSRPAAETTASLYAGLDTTILHTDLETAELIKYATNAYLAASVSFINEIANICESTGADISTVAEALALDSRIGPNAYVHAGVGFGGSCLPKDLAALIGMAERYGYKPRLLKAVRRVNELQPGRVVSRLEEIFPSLAGLAVAVLGLSFKGDVFDCRNSPALAIIRTLSERGATVRAFDPLADDSAAEYAGKLAELCADAYAAAEGAQAVIVATDHSGFEELDLARLAGAMKQRVLIDGRNVFDPVRARAAGFSYMGVGRPPRGE